MQSFASTPVTIPTNGVHLHAEVAGPEDGPLVILLHGFPEFWAGWIHQIGALARSGFCVVAPDQRGYNLSDKPARVDEYRIDLLAQDVTGIIDYFQRDKAAIIGHDWGAGVAWYTAMYYPERVERLGILNVPHFAAMNQALQKPDLRQLRKSWYMFFFQIPWLPVRLLRTGLPATFLHSARTGAFTPEILGRFKEAWSQPGALTGGMNWYRAMFRQAASMGREAFTRKFQVRVTVPTLILWGDRDAYLEPYLADRSLDWVENGKLVHFPEATHWIQHEEPERVNNRLIDFLRDVS